MYPLHFTLVYTLVLNGKISQQYQAAMVGVSCRRKEKSPPPWELDLKSIIRYSCLQYLNSSQTAAKRRHDLLETKPTHSSSAAFTSINLQIDKKYKRNKIRHPSTHPPRKSNTPSLTIHRVRRADDTNTISTTSV